MKLHPPKFPRGGLRELALAAIEDEAVYRGAVLEGGTLPLKHLQAVSFEGCVFREVNLRGLTWELVRLSDVRLENCDLSGAAWLDASLERVEVLNCRLLGFRLPEARLRHVRLNRVQAQLSMWQKADALHLHVEESDLTDAIFMDAALPGAVFRDCRLGRADFTRAKMEQADLRGSDLKRAGFTPHELNGVIVEPQQLLDLAHLLGVTVLPLDEDEQLS